MIHPFHKKLAAVLDRMGNLYTPQDILNAIAIGKMQSFTEGDSWAITQIALFPRGKVIEIIAMLGDGKDMPRLHDRILDFATEIGAGVIQAYGRKGWKPYALKRGWKVKAEAYVFQRTM
jgi:hypothetical protein